MYYYFPIQYHFRFGSVFTFLYSTFVIITGSFNGHIEGFPNEVFILNGILEIMQAILQVIFIHNLKEKVTSIIQT